MTSDRSMRFRCLRSGLWLGMGHTPTGERYAIRVFRVNGRWWHAEHRIDGQPVSASNAPTLAAHRILALAVTH